MRRVIWKYAFKITDVFSLIMPGNPEILSVQMQGSQSCIWAMVNPDESDTKHDFRVYGTGHSIDTSTPQRFIGTIQLDNGNLVFHIFQIVKTSGE